ncbi:MAG TPA: methyltransferase domain-containing protein [Rhodothermales bacterium]|nr:SAM-dependent methyltransferase [Bacteroidota bacterium]HRK73555.1 methyltransferase domain-containing protein [Rhodothermales bacterium]HRR08418.1 methyltransferase domain-containing protein [Rhodothermales bacterium]
MNVALKKMIRRIVAQLLRGHAYHCPVCDGRFRKFLPGGANKRANAQCPACGSLERHRAFWLFLQNFPLPEQPLRVLHFAPEACFEEAFRRWKNWTYVTTDLYVQEVDLKLDIEKLDVDNASYDLVMCHHVLPEVRNDVRALEELYRILTPGGYLLMQNPYDAHLLVTRHAADLSLAERHHLWGKYADQYQHHYGKDFPETLENIGFEIRIVQAETHFPSVLVQYNRLAGTLFVCKKPFGLA